MRQDAIDYFYGIGEDGDENRGYLKIGHALDPDERVSDLQTGNPRRLYKIFEVMGGLAVETEFKRKFRPDKIGNGGTEWFKVTPEVLNFIYEKLAESLLVRPHFSEEHEFGNGPSQLPTVELVESKLKPAAPVQSLGSIQPHGIMAASAPKNPYARIQKR